MAATRFLPMAGGGVSYGLGQSAAIDIGHRFGYVDIEELGIGTSTVYGASLTVRI